MIELQAVLDNIRENGIYAKVDALTLDAAIYTAKGNLDYWQRECSFYDEGIKFTRNRQVNKAIMSIKCKKRDGLKKAENDVRLLSEVMT